MTDRAATKGGADLIPLGDGAYTVADVCRILRPTMTRHKVHYWLNTGLLTEPPVAHRGPGVPTLLSFRQLLELRTVQHMRDELHITLPRVRQAFAWVLANTFADSATSVRFERGQRGEVLATDSRGETVEVGTEQRAFSIDSLNEVVTEAKTAWDRKLFVVPTHPEVVANARILGGAPTVAGTRIETALVAAFGEEGAFDDQTVATVLYTYPRLTVRQVEDALSFEGLVKQAA